MNMSFFGKLILIMDAKMVTPVMYGWFHLLFFSFAFASAYFLCKHYKNPDEKFVRRLLLVTSLVAVALEIYKQLSFSLSFSEGIVSYDYQWYAFPFQFCSTPMFAGLLAAVVPSKKVHYPLCAYLSTFSVFAGFCVMLYPAQVFIETIGVNVQTMICHGAMITIGIYLLYTEYVKAEHKTMKYAVSAFGVFIFIAMVLNEIAYYSGLLERETFNMFYISPHCAPSLPVYSSVQAVIPFPWCLLVYIAVFSLAAYVILLAAMGIKVLAKKRTNNSIKDETAVI